MVLPRRLWFYAFLPRKISARWFVPVIEGPQAISLWNGVELAGPSWKDGDPPQTFPVTCPRSLRYFSVSAIIGRQDGSTPLAESCLKRST